MNLRFEMAEDSPLEMTKQLLRLEEPRLAIAKSKVGAES